MCSAVERDNPGSTPASGGRILCTVILCSDSLTVFHLPPCHPIVGM